MIKFFRKIRYNLMATGKTSKYFKYAIGEIILVVIGILIALSINNWNEHQKAKTNEVELLKSLEKELSANIQLLSIINSKNKAYKNASKDVKAKLAEDTILITNEEMSGTFNYYSYTIDSPVLDAIIESNSNVLIEKKALIKDLRDLKQAYLRMKKAEYFLDELWNSKIVDFFVACGFSFESYTSQDPLIKIKDIELGSYSKKQLLGLINMKNDLQYYCDERQTQATEKSEELLRLLQSH
ncbi:hypothetical protein ES692_04865 [Psychroserpens burtonensis]|uniref:Uncharacterized protein n=1 Tax=Psychroserpens burtonensis TaxID=49278 RepID=A0A5C7B8Q8_9FLAO|nr:DUF6090 family protein [Psychroserpens burtonensis]TXE18786.1 hypothetical protein ES692_04865 [Psychroserpens burtonensis]